MEVIVVKGRGQYNERIRSVLEEGGIHVKAWAHRLDDALVHVDEDIPWLIGRDLEDTNGWHFADALQDAYPERIIFTIGSHIGYSLVEAELAKWPQQIRSLVETADQLPDARP